MKTIRKEKGLDTLFILADLTPAEEQAARELYYSPLPGGFGKAFPCDTPNLDQIYRNFEKYAPEMVLQAERVHPTPWDKALEAFLERVERQGIHWWVTGSTALAVRGLDIMPRDIDLVTDAAGAGKLGERLLEYTVEPVTPISGWICKWWGRAFLHARVEWVGEVIPSVDEPHPGDVGPAAEKQLQTVTWRGHQVRVPPLALQLAVTRRRGMTERAELIQRAMHDFV